jgi:O-antigen ligase
MIRTMSTNWSAGVLGGGAVGLLALADGGFFSSSWRLTTILACALAGIAVLLRTRITVGRIELALVGLLAAVAVWTGLSSLWSDDPALSVLEFERALAYVAAVGALVLLADRRHVRPLVRGVVVALVVVAAVALVASVGDPSYASLMGPVGYANALGILCVLALLLVPALPCILAVVAVPPLAVALVLTGSRGAWAALVAGLGVAAVARLGRRALVPIALVAAAAAAAFVLASPSVDLGDRPYYWRAALEEFQAEPLLGTGAGTFQLHWPELRPHDLRVLDTPDVLDAHSLYLESLAELGIVGFALVVAALAAPLWALATRPGEALTALLAPPYAAFLVHAGLDWDWEMPAVTLTGLACGAAAAVEARGDGRELGPRTRLAVLVVALGLAAFAAVRFILGPGSENLSAIA